MSNYGQPNYGQQGQLGFGQGLQDPNQTGYQDPNQNPSGIPIQNNPDANNDPNASGNDPRFAYGGDTGDSYIRRTDQSGRPIAMPAGYSETTDPNYYVKHGPNGAQLATARYQGMGTAWGGRAPQYAQLGQANSYLGMGDNTRSQQQQALGLQQQAAMGNAPSAAQQMMASGNADAMRNSLAMAGSARGAGAMGSAQYGAMQNNGLMAQQNISQMGTLRAQEMAQARDAYMNGASGMRQQDYGAAGMTAGWAQQNAGLGLQQQQVDLQGQLGFEQLGSHVQDQQLTASIAGANRDLSQYMNQTKLDRDATTDNITAGSNGASSGSGVLTSFM